VEKPTLDVDDITDERAREIAVGRFGCADLTKFIPFVRRFMEFTRCKTGAKKDVKNK
jgi:hypothetical protein